MPNTIEKIIKELDKRYSDGDVYGGVRKELKDFIRQSFKKAFAERDKKWENKIKKEYVKINKVK